MAVYGQAGLLGMTEAGICAGRLKLEAGICAGRVKSEAGICAGRLKWLLM